LSNITVAFAGSGESTLENTKALLNDYFNFGPEDKEEFPQVPDDLNLRIILPISDDHVTEPVMTVFDWTEYASLDYEGVLDEDTALSKRRSKDVKALIEYAVEDPDQVKNVNAEIIEALKADQKEGREAYLFLFWGESGDEHSEILLDLASAADIKVKDMTAGLDDLVFVDPTGAPEPDPVPEPEPKVEEPRRRGRARRSLEEEDKPLEDKPEPKVEPEEKPARRTRKAAEPAPTKDVVDEVKKEDREAAVDEEANARFKNDDHNTATPQDAEDVLVKALARKHEAKARPVSEDIRNRAGYHKANDDTAPLHTAIRKVTQDFMHLLDGLVPDGREKSLAMTNAEQAMFWANAAVARQGAVVTPEEPESPSVDQEPTQPSRGRGRPRSDGEPTKTRTAAEKAVKEVWNEEDEVWERAGRGRIPRGVKTRLVDPKTGDVVPD
jgi:hypothetical protein